MYNFVLLDYIVFKFMTQQYLVVAPSKNRHLCSAMYRMGRSGYRSRHLIVSLLCSTDTPNIFWSHHKLTRWQLDFASMVPL